MQTQENLNQKGDRNFTIVPSRNFTCHIWRWNEQNYRIQQWYQKDGFIYPWTSHFSISWCKLKIEKVSALFRRSLRSFRKRQKKVRSGSGHGRFGICLILGWSRWTTKWWKINDYRLNGQNSKISLLNRQDSKWIFRVNWLKSSLIIGTSSGGYY